MAITLARGQHVTLEFGPAEAPLRVEVHATRRTQLRVAAPRAVRVILPRAEKSAPSPQTPSTPEENP